MFDPPYDRALTKDQEIAGGAWPYRPAIPSFASDAGGLFKEYNIFPEKEVGTGTRPWPNQLGRLNNHLTR